MTYAEFFSEIRNKFIGADVSDIQEHLAYQFNIEDEEAGGIFYAEVKEGQLYVEPYEYYDRDAIFIATPDVLMQIAEGKLDPVHAHLEHQLRVEGNVDKALKLKDIIEKKQKAEKKTATPKKTAAKKTTVKAAPKTAASKTTATKKVTAKTTASKKTATKTTAKKTENK